MSEYEPNFTTSCSMSHELETIRMQFKQKSTFNNVTVASLLLAFMITG